MVGLRALLLACLLPAGAAAAGEWSGRLEGELRWFLEPPLFPAQDDARLQPSLAARPEYYHAWDAGEQAVLVVPFLRLDAVDEERTHADLREASYLRVFDGWELLAGIGKVFWGVTESQHLVDIVNQTDLVEDIRGEDKLGQPMVRAAWLRDWGLLEAFLLPGFRERTFPRPDGRLRSEPPVDTDHPIYASDRERRHVDYALRWSRSVGPWDLGVAWFDGTARDPVLVPAIAPDGTPRLRPRYDQIRQLGIDAQVLAGGWTFKLEALVRDSDAPEQDYAAAVGGFEYSFFGAVGARGDAGLLVEYSYDERGKRATSPFDDDLFVATRLTLNDPQGSELLAGVFLDLSDDSRSLWLRASRRLGARTVLSAQGRGFSKIEPQGLLAGFRQDSYLEATVQWYF